MLLEIFGYQLAIIALSRSVGKAPMQISTATGSNGIG
jgi:hypothetical protein